MESWILGESLVFGRKKHEEKVWRQNLLGFLSFSYKKSFVSGFFYLRKDLGKVCILGRKDPEETLLRSSNWERGVDMEIEEIYKFN